MCGGLQCILKADYNVSTYTPIEIDDISRAIGGRAISNLQEEFPRQLLDSAVRGCFKRLPQDIRLCWESQIRELVWERGPIHFVAADWQCQSMSRAGKHLGRDDERFLPFYDLIRIINYLQANKYPPPLYLIKNTWPGHPKKYPLVGRRKWWKRFRGHLSWWMLLGRGATPTVCAFFGATSAA